MCDVPEESIVAKNTFYFIHYLRVAAGPTFSVTFTATGSSESPDNLNMCFWTVEEPEEPGDRPEETDLLVHMAGVLLYELGEADVV